MNDLAPLIGFCITCGNRREHLEATLAKNLRDNRHYPRAKFVVLDYGSRDGVGTWVRERFPAELTSGRLLLYRTEAQHFHMAHAKNMAHRLAIEEGCEILVNLDADNFTGPAFAHYVAQQFDQAEEDREAIFLRARENHQGPGPGAWSRMPGGCGGRIVVTASTFLCAGGYDEQFAGWSPDDKDFAHRLEVLGFARHGIPRRHLGAVPHGDDIRFANYADGSTSSRGLGPQFRLAGREKVSVVNRGRFGMGAVTKFGDPAVTDLGPVPTRIFGIGMHKTATTSLAAALRQLGFSTGHWESPIWARNIVNELRAWRRSLTLEANYAIVDMPIPYLFRELDACYKGAKFILTIRDEAAWLKSLKAHWRLYFDEWTDNGFSHEMHRLVYGRADFDAHTMLERYARHNAEVLDHFRDRPDDLLVMNMSAGAGWAELAPFVGRPIPQGPYPTEFTTAARLKADGDYPR
jgi:Sulfotransferase domain/N-terminal domain of galactosyltransferase